LKFINIALAPLALVLLLMLCVALLRTKSSTAQRASRAEVK